MEKKQRFLEVSFKLVQQEKEDGPVLMNFGQGPPAEIGSNGIVFHLLENPEENKRTQRGLHGQTEQVDYYSKNFGDLAADKAPLKYAVACVAADNGKAELAPAPLIYRVRQQVHSLKTSAEYASPDGVQSAEERAMKKRILVDSFGSRKKQRAMRSAAANRIDISKQDSVDVVADALQKSAEQDVATVDATALLDAMKSTLLPRFDKEAKTPEEIYDINSIITPEEWDALPFKEVVKLTKKPSQLAKVVLDYPHIVGYLMSKLADTASSKQQLRHRAACVVYLTYLLRFSALPRHRKGDADALGCPEWMAERIISTFSQASPSNPERFSQTPELENKLRCYIAVLCFIASGFVLDHEAVKNLARDLGITLTAATTYLKEVGGQSGGRGAERKLELKAPLKLPSLRRGR